MSEIIEPLGARVLIRLLEQETHTPSGLVLPDTAKGKPQRGVVVAVGDDDDVKVAVGDTIFFAPYTGTELRLGDVDHLLMDAVDLLAVVRSATTENAA